MYICKFGSAPLGMLASVLGTGCPYCIMAS